jgi:hypothetical protein
MSKNLATFWDVKPFTRVAEMASRVLINNAGCLLKKDRSHFFPDADFSREHG